jgi:hypothetical protein
LLLYNWVGFMVTKVKIFPGVCQFTTVAQVEKIGKEMKIEIFSGCPNLGLFKEALKTVPVFDTVNLSKFNAVLKAGQTIPHACCAIPVGVIKACEAEMKMALKREVKIEFMDAMAKPEEKTES